MSRTIRKRYTGALVRDGQWTHRCPERDCDWCVRGRAKRAWRRRKRHEVWEREELPDAPVSSPGFVSQYIEDRRSPYDGTRIIGSFLDGPGLVELRDALVEMCQELELD